MRSSAATRGLAAEAHRHASWTHLQSRPRDSARNPGGERQGRGGNGAGIPPVNTGVLLLAHGAPERIEDVPQYLSLVRGGQPVSARVLDEVTSRYARIGGSSPLTHWTRVQAEALGRVLGVPVFFGMRNWHPFIQETMDQVRAAGVDRLACVCLAPQFSEMSVGLYMKRAMAAAAGVELAWATSYDVEPKLIEAFADYQSQGMSGGNWLGPTVEAGLDRYAAEGVREVLFAPIGFVCAHVEILYDI